MPHPLELSPALQAVLFKPNMPPITVRVIFKGRAKTASGSATFPTFSPTYSDVEWELTSRLKGSIALTFSKPIIPDGKFSNRISAGTLSLMLANPDGRIGAAGTDGIIDPANIDSGEVIVRVRIDGSVDEYDLYRGRVTQQPNESQHETILSLRDSLWDVLKTEMVYERYPGFPGGAAGMVVFNGLLFYQAHDTGTGFEAHAPYATFLEDGAIAANIDNGGGNIDINFANIYNGAPLGMFTVDFRSAQNYTLSAPDGGSFHGSISTDLVTPAIVIPSTAWTGADGTDTTIEIKIGNAVRGNPIAVVRNLIEKGLLKNFGEDPGTNPDISNLPAIWSTFDELQQRFWGWEISTVFTNGNNDVYQRSGGNRPLTYLEAAQQVMDHIGGNILRDGQGQIFLQGPYMDDVEPFTLDGNNAVMSHRIEGVRKYNYLSVQYGLNDTDGNYGSTVNFDLRVDPASEVEEATISLPMYKIGNNVHEIEVASTLYRNRVINSALRIETEVTPQFGVAPAPGDRYYVDLQQTPKVASYFEAYRVRVSPGKPATVNMHRIEPPTGAVSRFNAFQFGVSILG